MSDLSTEVLIQIRDEIKATRADLGARIDLTNVRLDQMTTRLDTHEKVLVRLVDLGERHEHALARVVNRLESLDDRFDNFLTGAHHNAHEEERKKLEDLDARVSRLEAREGRSA
jgi:hypothetical protein